MQTTVELHLLIHSHTDVVTGNVGFTNAPSLSFAFSFAQVQSCQGSGRGDTAAKRRSIWSLMLVVMGGQEGTMEGARRVAKRWVQANQLRCKCALKTKVLRSGVGWRQVTCYS